MHTKYLRFIPFCSVALISFSTIHFRSHLEFMPPTFCARNMFWLNWVLVKLCLNMFHENIPRTLLVIVTLYRNNLDCPLRVWEFMSMLHWARSLRDKKNSGLAAHHSLWESKSKWHILNSQQLYHSQKYTCVLR